MINKFKVQSPIQSGTKFKVSRGFTPHHNAPFVRTWVRGKSAKRNPQCPDRKVVGAGFTFIELILYISIVTIMLTAIVPFAWNIIGSGTKSSAEQEVFSQARYVSERIKYEIRNANSINSVNIPINTIDLNTPTNATTVIDLSGGKVRIKYGAAAAIEINSTDTSVTSLTFTDYTSSDNKTKHIQFTFTIDDAYGSSRQEYQVPAVTIESSVEVRSN